MGDKTIESVLRRRGTPEVIGNYGLLYITESFASGLNLRKHKGSPQTIHFLLIGQKVVFYSLLKTLE